MMRITILLFVYFINRKKVRIRVWEIVSVRDIASYALICR